MPEGTGSKCQPPWNQVQRYSSLAPKVLKVKVLIVYYSKGMYKAQIW